MGVQLGEITCKVIDSKEAGDGSIVVKIKKKYNTYSTEGYF